MIAGHKKTSWEKKMQIKKDRQIVQQMQKEMKDKAQALVDVRARLPAPTVPTCSSSFNLHASVPSSTSPSSRFCLSEDTCPRTRAIADLIGFPLQRRRLEVENKRKQKQANIERSIVVVPVSMASLLSTPLRQCVTQRGASLVLRCCVVLCASVWCVCASGL